MIGHHEWWNFLEGNQMHHMMLAHQFHYLINLLLYIDMGYHYSLTHTQEGYGGGGIDDVACCGEFGFLPKIPSLMIHNQEILVNLIYLFHFLLVRLDSCNQLLHY